MDPGKWENGKTLGDRKGSQNFQASMGIGLICNTKLSFRSLYSFFCLLRNSGLTPPSPWSVFTRSDGAHSATDVGGSISPHCGRFWQLHGGTNGCGGSTVLATWQPTICRTHAQGLAGSAINVAPSESLRQPCRRGLVVKIGTAPARSIDHGGRSRLRKC